MLGCEEGCGVTASVGEGAAVELGSEVKTGVAVGACEAASVAGTSVAGILGAGVSTEPGVPETFGLGAEEPPMSTMLPLPLPDGPHAVRKTVAANSRVPIIFFKYFIIINAEAKIPLSLLAENGRHDSGNKRPDKMLHDFRHRHNIMLLRRIQYLFVNIL